MKNKFWLVLLTITVGILFGLPHILIPFTVGLKNYTPFGGGPGNYSPITVEEVYTYVPEVQEILEGKGIVRDTQLAEYKKSPSPFFGEIFPSYIMAGLAVITGSVANGFIMADFIFPSLTFILAYLLGRKLNLSNYFSLATALVIVVCGDLISLVPYPKPTWDYLINLLRRDDFLFFSRNFNPQISFPLLLVTISMIIKAIENNNSKWCVLAGILFGINFYTYFFSWTTILFGMGLLVIYSLLTKKTDLTRRLMAILFPAFAVALPYLWNMWLFRGMPYVSDFFLKSSLPPRIFIPITARYLLLIVLSSLVIRKKPKSLIVLLSFILSGIVLSDLSVLIIGYDLEGKHWLKRTAMLLSILLTAEIGQYLFDKILREHNKIKLKRVEWVSFGIVVAIVLQFGIRVQVLASQRYAGSYVISHNKKELLDWINTETPTDSAIASLDTGLIAEIPALTRGNNVMPITIRSMATTEETLGRFLRLAAAYKIKPSDIERLLNEYGFISRIFYFKAIDSGEIFKLSKKQLKEIKSLYEKLLLQNNALESFPYKLDYIVAGPVEKLFMKGDFGTDESLQKVYENSDYILYRIIYNR